MAVHQLNNTTAIGSFIFNDTSMTVSHEGVAVKMDTTTPGAVVFAGAGETSVGLIGDTNLYLNGDPIPIYGIEGQIIDAYAGAAGFAAGDLIKVAASGYSVTAGSTDPYFAQAIDTATTGNLGRVMILGGGSIATNTTFTRSATTLRPTVDADTIATGPRATDAAVIEMAAANLVTNGTGANVNLAITCKGSGAPTFTNTSETATLFSRGISDWAQGTTGTAGTVGRITVSNLTATGVVVAFAAEDPGTNLVISDVVAGVGFFTVYTKDVTGTPTRAGLSGKKVNYFVKSLS